MIQRVIFVSRDDLGDIACALDQRIGNPFVIGSNEIIKSIHSFQILRGNDDKWHAIAVVNTQYENAPPFSPVREIL